jgi:hypothetical protein
MMTVVVAVAIEKVRRVDENRERKRVKVRTDKLATIKSERKNKEQ